MNVNNYLHIYIFSSICTRTARWTYCFFLIHNLIACARYIDQVLYFVDLHIVQIQISEMDKETLRKIMGGLYEASYFVIVLAVIGACIFGNSRNTSAAYNNSHVNNDSVIELSENVVRVNEQYPNETAYYSYNI